MKVADELLQGEIALAKGDRKGAITLMRQSVVSEAAVNYSEPPDWDLPVREWLGRALMMDGQYAEAEKTFREEIVPAAKPVVLKDLVKDWPVVRKIDLGIANVSAEVAVACVRRVDGPEFASRLRETADGFVELLDSLLPLADVSR